AGQPPRENLINLRQQKRFQNRHEWTESDFLTGCEGPKPRSPRCRKQSASNTRRKSGAYWKPTSSTRGTSEDRNPRSSVREQGRTDLSLPTLISISSPTFEPKHDRNSPVSARLPTARPAESAESRQQIWRSLKFGCEENEPREALSKSHP